MGKKINKEKKLNESSLKPTSCSVRVNSMYVITMLPCCCCLGSILF